MLTGKKANEYTNASTTALVNAKTCDWDGELIACLNLPRKMFQSVRMPGERLGRLRPEVAERVGFDAEVVLVASHDTGSAWLAVPAADNKAVYFSSGTWSLVGVQMRAPICTEASAGANFTNEGGYERRYRYLKNIMGLWMIQNVRRELGEVCESGGQPVPGTMGEYALCVYDSLADDYARTITQLRGLTGVDYTSINIVGGGSNNGYLNQATADACGLPVYAGPTEGTALGNLMVQFVFGGEYDSLEEARAAIRQSFEIKEYRPR